MLSTDQTPAEPAVWTSGDAAIDAYVAEIVARWSAPTEQQIAQIEAILFPDAIDPQPVRRAA